MNKLPKIYSISQFPYFVKEFDKFKKSIYFAASVSLDEIKNNLFNSHRNSPKPIE